MLFVTDWSMLGHKCPWDKYHIENPDRLRWILEHLEDNNCLDGVTTLSSRKASPEEIALVHDDEYIEQIRDLATMDDDQIEDYCTTMEDMYACKDTYEMARVAAGCAIDATVKAFQEKTNAFAAVRPPGHHAFKDAPCGFCIFNNVVLAAKHARFAGAQRIVIIDWDVHAGQGTQECIEGDDGILLISIHRFEEGKFWPNLEQSAVTQKFANTINVPLNEIGLGDSEYISIFHLVVLPAIASFNPDLIIVSCGFDAAIGDPEGEMLVSPDCYGRMTNLLLTMGAPVSMILEGGYFLPSIAMSAKAVIDALKGKEFNVLPQKPLPSSLAETIRLVHRRSDIPLLRSLNYLSKKAGHVPDLAQREYKGSRTVPDRYPTRDLYVEYTDVEKEKFLNLLNAAVDLYQCKGSAAKKISIHVVEDNIFVVEEGQDRHGRDTVSFTCSRGLAPLVHATLGSFFDPTAIATENSMQKPSEQELDKFFDELMRLKDHEPVANSPLLQLLSDH